MSAKKIYDWETWFARRRFELVRGFDFVCGLGSMSQQVRNAATRRGLKVRVAETANSLRVEVREEEPALASDS